MKFYTAMPKNLKPYVKAELLKSKECLDTNMMQSWRHLERAHIIGQPYPLQHTSVYWQMLKLGFTIKSAKEILGQLPRLAIGGVKFFVGRIPVGNTGGADVPALKPMPIPEDLQAIIKNNLN
jgi:hypothetical protein